MKNLLKNIFKKIGYEIYPIYTLPIHRRQLTLFSYFSRQFNLVKDLDGDIVECGVGKGRTLMYLTYLASLEESRSRNIWGFDSFEGFPEPSKEDVSDRNPKKGEWSQTSIKMVLEQLKRAGLPHKFIEQNINLIKGFFPTSFESYKKNQIAILHVDVDLYSSYKDVLSFFYPFVVSRGLILFDEYNQPTWPGAKKAVDEFLAENNLSLQHDVQANKYFIVKP